MNKVLIVIASLTFLVATAVQDRAPVYDNTNWDSVKELLSDWDNADDFTPQPYVNLGGRVYYFEPTLTANWYAAFEFCRRLNMFLVTIETKEENDLVKNYISEIGVGPYWTSGSDLAKFNEYIWSATGERVNFTDWHEGQPDHAGESEFAIYYLFANNTVMWADANPFAFIHFICEQS